MNHEEFKQKKLDDAGTRYQHYSDLISLWEESAELIAKYSHVSKHDQGRLDQLNASIELLRNTLDGMGDYKDMMISLRKLVDYIPTRPGDVEGGRGTPMRPLLDTDEFGDIG